MSEGAVPLHRNLSSRGYDAVRECFPTLNSYLQAINDIALPAMANKLAGFWLVVRCLCRLPGNGTTPPRRHLDSKLTRAQVLSSRDSFWEAIVNELNAHTAAFGDASCRAEAVSGQQVSNI